MLKPVEKFGNVKSIECSRHVESSQNCNFSRVNSFHDIICEFEQSGPSGLNFDTCDEQTAKGRNWALWKYEETRRARV